MLMVAYREVDVIYLRQCDANRCQVALQIQLDHQMKVMCYWQSCDAEVLFFSEKAGTGGCKGAST